jgi:hypothetical protein
MSGGHRLFQNGRFFCVPYIYDILRSVSSMNNRIHLCYNPDKVVPHYLPSVLLYSHIFLVLLSTTISKISLYFSPPPSSYYISCVKIAVSSLNQIIFFILNPSRCVFFKQTKENNKCCNISPLLYLWTI